MCKKFYNLKELFLNKTFRKNVRKIVILLSFAFTFDYLFNQEHIISKVSNHIVNANFATILFAFLLHVLVQILASTRLKLLILIREGVELEIRSLYSVTVLSNFLSQLLPSATVVAEGMRVALLESKLGGYKKIIAINSK